MPNLNFVKRALKDNPVAKKGEPYWWWKLKLDNRKFFSKTRPTPQQIIETTISTRGE